MKRPGLALARALRCVVGGDGVSVLYRRMVQAHIRGFSQDGAFGGSSIGGLVASVAGNAQRVVEGYGCSYSRRVWLLTRLGPSRPVCSTQVQGSTVTSRFLLTVE